MSKAESSTQSINWSLTTFNGSRREQLRRWAQLPLERVIAALEEMQELNDMLAELRTIEEFEPRPAAKSRSREQQCDYAAKKRNMPDRKQRRTD